MSTLELKGRLSGNKGRIYADALYPLHHHDVWEMVLILEGTGRFEIAGENYPISPGMIFCIPPYLDHQVIPDEFYNDYCVGVRDYLVPGNQVTIFHDNDDQLFYKMIQLYDEIFQKEPPNYGNILLGLEHAMQHLLISWQKQQPKRELIVLEGILRRNINNPNFELGTELEQIPMSTNYVRKLFREFYGMPPAAYMNKLRIDEARKHLVHPDFDMSIEELALHCGYTDPKYFMRLFRQTVGTSALNYRKRYSKHFARRNDV